jgi:type I restriction enzyme S subunit
MPIPVRNIEEQRRVVATVAQVEEESRGAAAMLGLSTDRLQELKRSLISAAVSGEFDVSTASGRGVPA